MTTKSTVKAKSTASEDDVVLTPDGPMVRTVRPATEDEKPHPDTKMSVEELHPVAS